MKSSIEVRKISIVDLDTDAIVNATNEDLIAGGMANVSGAIFNAAGYKKMQEACDVIAHCDTGDAVITPGFDLKAKYVIHAVGPIWKGGKHGEPEKLKKAYKKALELARTNHCRSIGYPLISAGSLGYPVKEAWEVAISACKEYLEEHKDYAVRIIFAVLDDEIRTIGKSIYKYEAGTYEVVQYDDWETKPMPELFETFVLARSFSDDEMNVLRCGHIPCAMEDKWFWCMEGDTLWVHRSWTGNCIYKIDFKEDNHHIVTVNRDPEQYTCKSIEEDYVTLNKLLNWWTDTPYDYCHEWLSETLDSLKRAGKV